MDGPTPRLIADRGEFVDALRLLRNGHVLVRLSDRPGGCLLDGGILYHSLPTLERYGLVDEFENPQGFANARYYRITPRGRDFAERAWSAWRGRPLLQRMAMRILG